jgi:hypothetical protein
VRDPAEIDPVVTPAMVRAWMSWEMVVMPWPITGSGALGHNHEDFQNYDGYGHGKNDQPCDIRDAVDDPPSCTS